MRKTIAISFLFCVSTLSVVYSQAIPTSAYGIWDRGESEIDFSDSSYDFIVGIESESEWSQVNPERNRFDFSVFQRALDRAYKNHRFIRFSISVGPAAPRWMYDSDLNPNNNPYPQVRKVTTSGGNDHEKFPFYPQYLSDTYKSYLFELIREFALFIQSQPKKKFDLILFVQVKTGCTGDEVPYKGKVDNLADAISPHDWESFRIEVFNEYKKWFNDVAERKTVLTFNGVDPNDPEKTKAWNWVVTNIDPSIGFGIKGGAYNRGHHLTGEQTYAETWIPYLVNPQGLKLFSASEMDQSWRKGYFSINPPLGFYWAAMVALNVGLSSCSVSKSAMDYAKENEKVLDIFRLYTQYSQQINPRTASVAFSVFHEGLNAANIEKFPEKTYGKAQQGNVERYRRIVQDYAAKGARIDDFEALTKGQVFQRENQKGYNDVGWDIAEGNIERFLTQIAPDSTSIALFRLRGKLGIDSSPYDRFARSFDNANGKNSMLFKFDKELFIDSKPKSLTISITWLDQNAGSSWEIKYFNGEGALVSALKTVGMGDKKWKTATASITNIDVSRTFQSGANFMLVNTDRIDDVFSGIEVKIER